MNRRRISSSVGFLTLLLLFVVQAAHSTIDLQPLSTEALESRYRHLIEELRCPKCQNQNLAGSDSPIAADLREQVRVLLEEGKNDEQVVNFLVDRYGDFVRYRPAVKQNTLVLWFAPGLLALIALIGVVLVVRHFRQPKVANRSLSNSEQQHLAALLKTVEPSAGKAAAYHKEHKKDNQP